MNRALNFMLWVLSVNCWPGFRSHSNHEVHHGFCRRLRVFGLYTLAKCGSGKDKAPSPLSWPGLEVPITVRPFTYKRDTQLVILMVKIESEVSLFHFFFFLPPIKNVFFFSLITLIYIFVIILIVRILWTMHEFVSCLLPLEFITDDVLVLPSQYRKVFLRIW